METTRGQKEADAVIRLRRSARLQLVPELAPYEIAVGALCAAHVGKIVVVKVNRNVLMGPLMSLPSKSVSKPLLVLRVGEFSKALHPGDVVTVVPSDHKVTITVSKKPLTVARDGRID